MIFQRLELVNGLRRVNLLSRQYNGIHLKQWDPAEPGIKGGGAWLNSPFVEGQRLLDATLDNVIETMTLAISGRDHIEAKEYIDDLRSILHLGRNYWVGGRSSTPTYLLKQSKHDSFPKYALVNSFSAPNDIASMDTNRSPVMDEFGLVINRGQWLTSPPTQGNVIPLTRQGYLARVGALGDGSAVYNDKNQSMSGSSTTSIVSRGSGTANTGSTFGNNGGVYFHHAFRFNLFAKLRELNILHGAGGLDGLGTNWGINASWLTFTAQANRTNASAPLLRVASKLEFNPGEFPSQYTFAQLLALPHSEYTNLTMPLTYSLNAKFSVRINSLLYLFAGFGSEQNFPEHVVIFVEDNTSPASAYIPFWLYHADIDKRPTLTVDLDIGTTHFTVEVESEYGNLDGLAGYPGEQFGETLGYYPLRGATYWSPAELNRIYFFDASAAAGSQFSTRVLDKVQPWTPGNLFQIGDTNGDMIYFGSLEQNGIYGQLRSILMRFAAGSTLYGQGMTYVWEVYSSAAAGWVDITADVNEDLTVNPAFATYTGFHYIQVEIRSHTTQFWDPTTVNGDNGYWLRLRFTGGTISANVQCADFPPYNSAKPYFDIHKDLITGDLPALLSVVLTGQLGINQDIEYIVAGMRTFDYMRPNGMFSSFVPFQTDVYKDTAYLAYVATGTLVNCIETARLSFISKCLHQRTTDGTATFELTLSTAVYSGRFRAFYAYLPETMGAGFQNALAVSYAVEISNLFGEESDPVVLQAPTSFSSYGYEILLADLGVIELPGRPIVSSRTPIGGESSSFNVRFTSTRVTGTPGCFHHGIFLIPVDEWGIEFYNTNGDASPLLIDNVSDPKVGQIISGSSAPAVFSVNGELKASPGLFNRIYFHCFQEYTDHVGNPAMSMNLTAQQFLYASMVSRFST